MFANLVVELKKHHYSQRGLAAKRQTSYFPTEYR